VEAEERAAEAEAAVEAANERAATAEAAEAAADQEARGLESLCLDLRDQVQPAARPVCAGVSHPSFRLCRMLTTLLGCPVAADRRRSL